MGHAFGLGHLCIAHATIDTPTNIMASTQNCEGSGGQRNIGFDDDQVATIMANAERSHSRLGLTGHQFVPQIVGTSASHSVMEGESWR